MSRDWFEILFGFEEKSKSYEEVQACFEVAGDKLRSKINGKEFTIGHFSTPTLHELRVEGLRLLELHSPEKKQRLILSHRVTSDILEEHGKVDNRYALFQVASQFNCLEFVSPARTPEHGVTCYDLDHTQGPACAIAAGAATVYRNYFVPVLRSTLHSNDSPPSQVPDEFQVGQTASLQLDCLDRLAAELKNSEQKFWIMRNGYINSSSLKLDRLRPLLDPNERDIDVLRQLIKVGLHHNVQVTTTPDNSCEQDDSKTGVNLVSQVFCSAVGVSYTLPRAEEWRLLALLVLEAAYEATLWVAVINFFATKRTSKIPVFLTSLGGGAFGNPREWIAYALARAVAVLESAGAGSIVDCRMMHFRAVDDKMVELIDEQLITERAREQDFS